MKSLSNEQTNSIDTLIKLNDKKLLNESHNLNLQQQRHDINFIKMNNVMAEETTTTKINNDSSRNTNGEDSLYNCGFGRWRPKWLQRFLSAKWALFWLCWAGAMQGKKRFSFENDAR
jgi:hypothetical protein